VPYLKRWVLTLVAVVLCLTLFAGVVVYYNASLVNFSLNRKSLFVLSAPVAQPILSRVLPVFESKYGVEVHVSYGASGSIFATLKLRNASVDLIIFASEDWGGRAEAEGLVFNESKSVFAYQLAVVFVREGLQGIACVDDLARPGLKIGIVNPKVAPIGYEALHYFNQSKSSEKIKSNVVYLAKDVGELVAVFKTGALDAIVAWHVYYEQLRNISYVVYPWSCGYRYNIYGLVGYVAKASTQPKLAQELLNFIAYSDVSKDVMKDLGYFTSVDEVLSYVSASFKG